MKWKIFNRSGFLIIEADSFDEAISKAREISPDYSGGQPLKEGDRECRSR